VLGLLRTLNETLGKTVLMVTHDPHAAEAAKVRRRLDKGSSRDARRPLGAQRLPAQQDPRFPHRSGGRDHHGCLPLPANGAHRLVREQRGVLGRPHRHPNAISLTQSLPLAYSDRIAQIPGVTRLTWSNWFGGIYKDRKNFFAQFAIDAASALEVFDIRFVQGDKANFLGDRNACIVGKGLAEKFGWKVGDTVPLFSEIYPGDWKFRIAGVVEGADDASIANTMYFHWARLNEGLPDRIKNSVGVFTMKVANADDSPRVIRDVDALFANSEAETHTETEKAFRLQFVTGSSAILTALQVVSAVILVIMALILGTRWRWGFGSAPESWASCAPSVSCPRTSGPSPSAKGPCWAPSVASSGAFSPSRCCAGSAGQPPASASSPTSRTRFRRRP